LHSLSVNLLANQCRDRAEDLSEAAVFFMVGKLLGLKVDSSAISVTARRLLLADRIDQLALRNIQVGTTKMAISCTRAEHTVEVTVC